jgi:hypothetical protein
MISHFELSVSSLAINISLFLLLGNFQVLPYLNHGMFHLFHQFWSKYGLVHWMLVVEPDYIHDSKVFFFSRVYTP